LLTVLAVGAATVAVDQRNTARAERDVANSRRLAADALDAMADDLDLGLLLTVESYQLAATRQARDSLLTGRLTEPGLLRYLHGHTNSITSLAGSNGNVVSVGADGQVIIWDRTRGKAVDRFQLPVGQEADVAVSPDGSRIAFDRNGDVVLRELTSRRDTVLDNAKAGVQRLAFSPDGRRLAAVDGDLGLVVWSMERRTPRRWRNCPVSDTALHSTPEGDGWQSGSLTAK
jgi:WD40 repeat protein